MEDLKCPVCAKSLSTGGQLVTTKCGCRIMHKDCFHLIFFRKCPAPNCQKWVYKNEVFNVFMDPWNPEEIPKKIPRLLSTPPRPNILGLPQGNRATPWCWEWDANAASKRVVPTREPICGHQKCITAQNTSLKTCERYKKLVKKFSRQEARIRNALEEKANYERELRMVQGNGGRGNQEVYQESVEEYESESNSDEADY